MAERGVDFRITAQDWATAVFANVERGLERMEGAFKSISKFGGLLSGAFAAKEIIDGVDKIIEKGKEWEASNNRIIGILRATQSSVGLTKEEIDGLAESLSKVSLADDDAIKDVASTLLKFGNIQEDVFKRATRASLDLAGVMGNDFSGAAQKLGQALANPAEGLKGLQQEIGKLNPAEQQAIEDLVRHGDLLGAQVKILSIVESRVGGLAEALNTGLSRATKESTQAWDDLLKSIARTESFRSGVVGFFDDTTHAMEKTKALVEDGWFDKLVSYYKIVGGLFNNPAGLANQAIDAIRARRLGGTGTDTAGDLDDATVGEAGRALAASRSAEAKREEERRALLLANAQKMAAAQIGAIKSEAQGVLEAEKNLGAARLQVLDLYNERGLVSVKDFYDTRLTIAQAEIAAAIAAIDKSVAAERGKIGSLPTPELRMGAQTSVDEQLRKREELVKRLGVTAVTSTLQQQKAEQDLRDTLTQVNADVARSQGSLAAAAALEFEVQNRKLREQLKQPSNVDMLKSFGIADPQKLLDTKKDLLVLEAKYQQSQVQGAAILDTIGSKESLIESARKQGAITDIEALRQRGELYQNNIDKLRGIGEALSYVAQQTANPQLIAQAEQFKAKIEDLAASVDLLGQRARTTFEEGLTGFLDATIGRTKTLKDAFRDMISDIGRQLLHLENQQIAQAILGKSGAGGLFAGGDVFGNIAKFIFGGGGGGSSNSLAGAGIGASGAFEGFATGGDFTVGGNGGTDSQRVSFWATPGEQVSIRTPTQQRGGAMTIDARTYINAPGATVDAIKALGPILADHQRAIERLSSSDDYRRGGSTRRLFRG